MKWRWALVSTLDLEFKGYPRSETSQEPAPDSESGTLVARIRGRTGETSKSNFRRQREIFHKLEEEGNSPQNGATANDFLIKTLFSGTVEPQLMWNSDWESEKYWLNILQARSVARGKISWNKHAKRAEFEPEIWYLDLRVGRKLGPLRIYFRRRKRKNSYLEFWFLHEKIVHSKDKKKTPKPIADFFGIVDLYYERLLWSNAVRIRIASGKSPKRKSNLSKPKTRLVSRLLVFGLIGSIYLTWLYNMPWGEAHRNFVTNWFWFTLLSFCIGLSRTSAFRLNNIFGFGVAFACAAGYAKHFHWSLMDCRLSVAFALASVLLLLVGWGLHHARK